VKIGIIGAGRIGGGIARQLGAAGHQLMLSFSRNQAELDQLAARITSGFQAEAAVRTGDERVVQWLCSDDPGAKKVVAGLIEDAGFVPVDLGGTAGCAVMEAPRRPGAVYGEEYRAADAAAVAEAVRAGRPIPPTPQYYS
jgi:predicted dinucleotide-binding enzyme